MNPFCSKLPCQVECYGRGTVHKDICSNLNIKHAAEANIPCILFVYKVSREIEDLRNALRWIT
ncbi:hypothetical protein chiPu_0022078, partial [Chiloscyllium punctatum]|nr:hypothetical protein [Chiloscyllium punctatum]